MVRTTALLAAGALLLHTSQACRATQEYKFDDNDAATVAKFSSDQQGPLRLLKTSEDDPGVWVTEKEKIENYMLKHVHFMDITETPVFPPAHGGSSLVLTKG